MKVYFCGDLHLREDEPFFSSCTYVLKDLTKRVNCGDVIVFAGDFFHKQTPTIKELKTARVFFDVMNRKACQVIICAGNHEYNGAKDAFVEDIFTEFDVVLIDRIVFSNSISQLSSHIITQLNILLFSSKLFNKL